MTMTLLPNLAYVKISPSTSSRGNPSSPRPTKTNHNFRTPEGTLLKTLVPPMTLTISLKRVKEKGAMEESLANSESVTTPTPLSSFSSGSHPKKRGTEKYV